MQFTIWIVSPPNYLHSKCFEEVALALCSGLNELGHEAKVVTSSFDIRGRTIVLGAHLLAGPASFMDSVDLPDDMIIYNLEQVCEGSPWMTEQYLDLLRGQYDGKHIKIHRKFEVWDYSEKNIEALKALGIEAKHCPIGYAPELTRIKKYVVEGPLTDLDIHPEKIRFRQQVTEINQDIDCCFFGSLNSRRNKIINDLKTKGLNVVARFGVYGERRDAIIARSKVCLNMHHYPAKTFEVVRVSYLLSNSKCVVSEVGHDSIEDDYRKAVSFAEYGDLVSRCLFFVRNDEERRRQERHGYEVFSGMKQSEYLKAVLE
jgi:hypothetical protein